jgi:hypothetical protein
MGYSRALPGPRLVGDRFSLLGLSGQGSAGSVYQAIDTFAGGYAAVKLLRASTADSRAQQRFEREVALLSEIRAPHLARYVAHGFDSDREVYLAVEWIEGEDLGKTMRRRRVLPAEALEIVAQTLSGLEALHARGVVHRDVKPGNIMLGATTAGLTEATLIDLGVAHVDGDLHLTQQGMMIGTPHFMSPEQILGEDVTPAADVFSMGVVLFELLAGARAYVGEDVVELVAKIALADPPRLRDHAPNLPSKVYEVVDRAMRRDPRARFADAGAMRAAVVLAQAEQRARTSWVPAAGAMTEPDEADATAITAAPVMVDLGATTDAPLAHVAERRVVTALFAHLPVGPEKASVFEEIVARQGGRPHTLLSVAHVAVFGAERSVGDEPRRAARAALELAAQLGAVRVAISTGRALTGDAEVSGDAIERGARLLERRVFGEIGVDDATARMLSDGFELLGASDGPRLVREREEARAPATPLVGRVRELEELSRALLERLDAPRSAVVRVTGAGGVGKTRLLREALARVRETHPGVRVLVARPSSLARLSAFSTLRSGLRGHLHRSSGAAHEVALRPLLAELNRLGDRELSYQNDPVLALDRVRDLLEAWVMGENPPASPGASGPPPTLFVVDDLHFADVPSLRLLAGVKRHLPAAPFLVVGAGREEPSESALSDAADFTLSLEPLPEADARELATVVGGAAIDPDAIGARALGNPFVVEELAKLARTGASAGLPETVLSLLQARLDALLPAEKRYAAFASVFGPTFFLDGVARILGDPRDVVEHVTERLVSAGVLEALEGHEEDVFAFKSELLREAAYESLVDADRAEAHRRAALFLESKALAEPMVLARHFELAHLPARAARYFVGAAELALFGNDFAGAMSCAQSALDAGVVDGMRGRAELVLAEANRWRGELALARAAAERAVASFPRGSMEWFFAVRERIAALGRLGEIGKIPALVDETFAASVEPGAESAQIAALVPAIIHLLYAGDLAAAKELAARLDTDAVDPASLLPFARARMYQLRAGLSQYDGNLAAAVRNQEFARAEFHEARDQRGFALATSNLAFTLMTLGENERAEALCRETIRLAERLSLATVLPLAQQNLGTVRARRGFYEEAVALQTTARAAFEARRDPRLAGVSSVHLALALDRLGRHPDALSEIARVLWGGFQSLQFAAFAAKATVELALGRVGDAVDSARSANELLDKLGSVEEFEIKTRLVLAEALYAAGEATLALEALERVRVRLEGWAAGLGDPGLVPAFYWNVPEHARVLELCGIAKDGRPSGRLIP